MVVWGERSKDGCVGWEVKRWLSGVGGQEMVVWGGRSKGLHPNISVCHLINISCRIAILFFICSLIIFNHNFI